MNVMGADRCLSPASAPSSRQECLNKRSSSARFGHLRGIKEIKIAVFAPAYQEAIRKDGWRRGAQILVRNRVPCVLKNCFVGVKFKRGRSGVQANETFAKVRSSHSCSIRVSISAAEVDSSASITDGSFACLPDTALGTSRCGAKDAALLERCSF